MSNNMYLEGYTVSKYCTVFSIYLHLNRKELEEIKCKSDDVSKKYWVTLEEVGFTACKESQTDPVEIFACREALAKVTE